MDKIKVGNPTRTWMALDKSRWRLCGNTETSKCCIVVTAPETTSTHGGLLLALGLLLIYLSSAISCQPDTTQMKSPPKWGSRPQWESTMQNRNTTAGEVAACAGQSSGATGWACKQCHNGICLPEPTANSLLGVWVGLWHRKRKQKTLLKNDPSVKDPFLLTLDSFCSRCGSKPLLV